MEAGLGDPTVLDDEDEVRGAHRGQAVRDDHGGASAQRLDERGLNGRLGGGVQMDGGLVEDHHLGPCQ